MLEDNEDFCLLKSYKEGKDVKKNFKLLNVILLQ